MADQNTASSAIPVRVLIVDTNGNPIAGGVASAVTIANGGDFVQGSVADVAWVSGDGTVIALLKKIASAGGSAVTIADAANVVEGALADAAVVTDANGTISGKLRGIVKILGTTGITFASPQHVITDSGTTVVTQPTGTNLHAVLDATSTTAVTQATGTNLHAVIDTGSTTAATQATAANLKALVDINAGQTLGTVTTVGAVTTITNVVHVDDNAGSLTVDGTVALAAGSAVIGHVITDATSVTNATLTAETTKVIGTVNVASGQTIGISTGTAEIGNVKNSGTFAVQSTETRPTTPVVTLADFSAISDTTRALTILAANAARRGATIRNDTDTAIRIQEGGTASATSYTDILPPGGRYVLDYPASTALISAFLPQIPDGRLFITERA